MTEKPFTIVAFMGVQALGDFIMHHVAAASVARAIPGSRLAAIHRDDRPYKNFIAAMNPWVSQVRRIPADPRCVFPLDSLAGQVDDGAEGAAWRAGGFHSPDLFLTPPMMRLEQCIGCPPALRIPPAEAPVLEARLVARGLDPTRWFAGLHMREGAYQHRSSAPPERNVDPFTYVPTIKRIIGAGGQVVRLGDPSMTPLPAMTDLIDIRDATFPEQAAAVARARFFFGTDTGPTQLACALKVPTATTNAVTITVWNDGDVALMKRQPRAEGGYFPLSDLLSAGCLTLHAWRPHPFEFESNGPDELLAVAERMIAATDDCPAWRPPRPEEQAQGPVPVSIPLGIRETTEMAHIHLMEQAT